MTDYELNKAIADALGLQYDPDTIWATDYVKDYCDSWGDLMPLVVEQNFDYEVVESTLGWRVIASYSSSEYESTSKTQQRALAECLLKVLTNES